MIDTNAIYIPSGTPPAQAQQIRSDGLMHTLLALADETGIYLYDRRTHTQRFLSLETIQRLCGSRSCAGSETRV